MAISDSSMIEFRLLARICSHIFCSYTIVWHSYPDVHSPAIALRATVLGIMMVYLTLIRWFWQDVFGFGSSLEKRCRNV